jgi:hypothetical protein
MEKIRTQVWIPAEIPEPRVSCYICKEELEWRQIKNPTISVLMIEVFPCKKCKT